MRLLLDTHTFLWFISGDSKITNTAISLIENLENEKFFSMASVWEIAIKMSLGKLTLSLSLDEFLPMQLQQNGINLLSITTPHTIEVAKLPFHHRDPFDRLLIAQSLTESMPIISADAIFSKYTKRLW